MWPQLVNLSNFGLGMTGSRWWKAAGIMPVAVYQAKGAVNYGASLVNLANPGTYNLTEGNGAIPWDTVNGWKFTAAANQYLISNLVLGLTYSAFIQFTGVTTTGDNTLFGVFDVGPGQFYYIQPRKTAGSSFFNVGQPAALATAYANGNLGCAGKNIYVNGVANGVIPVGGTEPVSGFFIAAVNLAAGTPLFHITANIQAMVVFDATISATQVAFIVAAMAGL